MAPPILEEIYNVEDALAFGGMCISLLNHADRVAVARLAQLVNAVAPIMTETGGPAWRQTIFWPFMHFSRLGRGRVLRTEIDSPTYATRYNDPNGAEDTYFPLPAVPYLKLAAVHDAEGRRLTLFALNRSPTDELPFRLDALGYDGLSLNQAVQFHDTDLEAINSKTAPDRVTPRPLGSVRVGGQRVEATLMPASWNVTELNAPSSG